MSNLYNDIPSLLKSHRNIVFETVAHEVFFDDRHLGSQVIDYHVAPRRPIYSSRRLATYMESLAPGINWAESYDPDSSINEFWYGLRIAQEGIDGRRLDDLSNMGFKITGNYGDQAEVSLTRTHQLWLYPSREFMADAMADIDPYWTGRLSSMGLNPVMTSLVRPFRRLVEPATKLIDRSHVAV